MSFGLNATISNIYLNQNIYKTKNVIMLEHKLKNGAWLVLKVIIHKLALTLCLICLRSFAFL